MSYWRMLDSVPKDHTDVLFWEPHNQTEPFGDGDVVTGCYDVALDSYSSVGGDMIYPIAWMPCPRGPRDPSELWMDRPDYGEDEPTPLETRLKALSDEWGKS